VGAGAAELDVALALRGSIANLARYPHLAALRDALDAGAPAPDVVLVAFNARTTNAGAEHIAAAAAEVSCEALALLQSWLADERLASARLVLLSERAIATRPDEDVPGLVQAPLWGIVRSAQSENTGHSVLCVDIDATDASRRALPAALSAAEPQLALREGRRLVPRLARVPALAASTGRARSLDPDGTVLITGGTGTLGGLVASHLVHEHGIKHLLLASRQGDAAPGVEVLTRELEAAGASVTVARCDSADRRALEQLFAAVPSGRPLTAVVHAAGILDDGMLGSLTPERLRLVLRSKVDAALHLHELTKSLDLSAFVLFSSLAGVLGSPGQASYAAANSFLDALAHHRRAQALPAIALDWSLWAQKSAMTGHLVDADLRRMARGGLRPLASVEGLALFDAALARQESALVIAHFDLAALRARAGSLHPIFSGLVQVRAPRPVAVNVADATSFKQRLLAQPAAERERALVDLVRTQVAAVLGVSSPAVVELDRPLQELGLDSIMAVEIRNRLTMATGLRLPATLLFNYPTASALALCLQSKLTDLPRTDSKSTLSDYEIHAAIASVSLDRLREAGLLDRLLALALSRTDLAPVDAKDAVSEIASMSVDDLVRIALENPQNG
jgi:NADP-dependent 3-hydroxy acid dehydrogenase YdfG/acyl carrier protein